MVCADPDPADVAVLQSKPDVYVFPDDLSGPVADPSIDVFFDAINLPTNWLTPSSTYLDLVKRTAGIVLFNQTFAGISGGLSIWDNGTNLDTRLRDLPSNYVEYFFQSIEAYGLPRSAINVNQSLRTLVRQAGSYWDSLPIKFGRVTI